MSWNPNRSSKTEARRLAMDFTPGKKSILMLPGLHCLDLDLGHKLGLFAPQAEFALVEKDPATAKNIFAYCKGDPRYNVFVKKLETVRDGLPKRIDFAYIDLCGAITRNLTKWFPFFFNNVADRAEVAITMCLQKRGNKQYLNELLEEFHAQEPHDYKEAYDHYVINENLPEWIAEVMCAQLWPVLKSAKQAGLTVQKCLFHTYQDSLGSGWMCLYRLTTIRNTNMPNLSQEMYEAKTRGKKASVTRRIRAKAKAQAAIGKSPVMVVAGYKAAATVLKNKLQGNDKPKTGDKPKQLAAAFVAAETPQKKAAIKRKMANIAKQRAADEGISETQCLAGFESWITRLS